MLGEVDNQMKKGDYKAEVIFIGEVVGASNYVSDGELYAEILINAGEHWELLSASPRHFITQACTQSDDGKYTWCHPFQLHYKTDSIYGWPYLFARIMRLDSIGKIDIVGYATCHLPNKLGNSKIKFHSWIPKGGLIDEAYSFFVGNSKALKSIDILAGKDEQRISLESKSSADITIECSTIFKNLGAIGVVKEKLTESSQDIVQE